MIVQLEVRLDVENDEHADDLCYLVEEALQGQDVENVVAYELDEEWRPKRLIPESVGGAAA